MSKLLSLAALLFASTAAAANSVVPIAESEAGDRLLAIPQTFQMKPNNRGLLVAGVVTYWASRPNTHFYWAVDATSCSKGSGEIIVANVATEQIERYFWTVSGNRIYDTVALQLCSVKKTIDESNANPDRDNRQENEGPSESV